jgi:hypothetical protein
MTIATQNDLINARANKRQTMSARRLSIANQAAATLASLYRAGSTSSQMPQPAIPTVAALCDKTLSWNFNNAAGADKTYLDTISGNQTNAQRTVFYDRLFHIGGLNGTLTTAQTVNSQTVLTLPSRFSIADSCEWFLECYADLGATTTTATVAVTFTDTTTTTISVTIPATWRAGRLLQIVPPVGKIIASVQSVTLGVSTGTAGNFGVTCGDRMTDVTIENISGNIPTPPKRAVFKEIANNTCIWAVVECSTTTSGDVMLEISLIQG